MKPISITVPVSNNKEMNNLVDATCEIMGEDSVTLRDKFKMIDQADSKKLLDLCNHLGLDVEFKSKKKEVSVKFIVENKFDISSFMSKYNEVEKPKPVEVVTQGIPVTGTTEKTNEAPPLDENLNKGDEGQEEEEEEEEDELPF